MKGLSYELRIMKIIWTLSWSISFNCKYVILILESLYKIQKAEEGCLADPTTSGSTNKYTRINYIPTSWTSFLISFIISSQSIISLEDKITKYNTLTEFGRNNENP